MKRKILYACDGGVDQAAKNSGEKLIQLQSNATDSVRCIVPAGCYDINQTFAIESFFMGAALVGRHARRRRMTLHRLAAFSLALLILIPLSAKAQTPTAPAAASSDQLLKPEELDALVAPIALYPDTLLSLVLMASSYPP